jgi:hypothetical protein
VKNLLLGVLLLSAAFPALAGPALAGEADVVKVVARYRGGLVYDFDVTVRSRDTGWTRYADQLEAITPEGRVLGVRVLDHPHDDEQPFTRDLYGVNIPAGMREVIIRARFKPVGYDGVVARVMLPGR